MCSFGNFKKSLKTTNHKMSCRTSAQSKRNCLSKLLPETKQKHMDANAKILENVAAHFGKFYGLKEDSSIQSAGDSSLKSTVIRSPEIKTEFTRQMVHVLESVAGTTDYARKISSLLEETVEPPNFKVIEPPKDNSVPDGKHNPTGFPIWYKDPYKIPTLIEDRYNKISDAKENYTNIKSIYYDSDEYFNNNDNFY